MRIGKVAFFSSKEETEKHMEKLVGRPQVCPICNYSVSPDYKLLHIRDWMSKEVLCKCPREKCGALFFATYMYDENPNPLPWEEDEGYVYTFKYAYPKGKEKATFPQEIVELSAGFIDIYNQAYIAEQEGLNLICGVGYRKSLEFLIKDFAIKINPLSVEGIKKDTLMNCLKKYVDHPKIKAMAERAVWLGNDETHYERKWKEKDIQDLKTLIRLTVGYIELHLVSEIYELEMESGRK
ncbi:DUF4145 domain-containing protein [Bacillus toyonensis]|uniref:DUF4145 domain-containing protein n=1 Tax=Bacillus toyonensis TaxID=155322 RepID=UPI001906451D|nr:DUF4145 domain-containing protein [Bacillus toyonensis]QQN86682.1 DUF4145 domain-containing protein [Bacillus toyonensis]